MRCVELKVIFKRAARFIYVGSGLGEGKRQAIHLFDDAFSSIAICCLRLFEWGITAQAFGPTQQEQDAVLQTQFLYFDGDRDCAEGLSACCEQEMAFVEGGEKFLPHG